MRKGRSGRGLFQKSWPVRFESLPAPTDAQSIGEEDEACVAAADFVAIESCRGLADSTRTAHKPG